jgi:uncharacterized Fe-S cluster-containing radical SAM superfamily protein
MIDPIKLASHTKNVISKGKKRRYYRFRPSRFYGGIATADCLGCILRCVFCWSWKKLAHPGKHGRFYSPEQVANRLTSIAKRRNFPQVRISGSEPTIAEEHLLDVLDWVPRDLLFILETNGILIGYEEGYAKELARFPNLHVRVSLKGTTNEEFSRLTGADSSGFQWQLKALENLAKEGVSCNPSVMISFSSPENVVSLRKYLASIERDFFHFEEEELILYPSVEERLKKANIQYRHAYYPDNIPAGQI